MKQFSLVAVMAAAVVAWALPVSSPSAANRLMAHTAALTNVGASAPQLLCRWILLNGKWYCIPY
jgi:hypothetical protein